MITKGQKQFSEKQIIEDSGTKDINEIKRDRITDEELERFDYELTKKFEEFKCFLRVKSENQGSYLKPNKKLFSTVHSLKGIDIFLSKRDWINGKHGLTIS